MTRGRSNKVLEVDWRKNCKSYKRFPLIQLYLNIYDLGLFEVSVRNFKQYLKCKIIWRISVSCSTQRVVLAYTEKSLHADSLTWERKNTSLFTLPPHTSLLPPGKCKNLRRRRKQYSCLTEDSNIIFCSNSYQQEHQN